MNSKTCNINWVLETSGKTYSTTINRRIISEIPTTGLRWLVKKDGTKVLQQAYEIHENNTFEIKWKDIREVEDEV